LSKQIKIFMVIAVVGAAAVWYMMSGSSGPAGGPMGGMGGRPPTAVSFLALKSETIALQETLPGRVAALRQAEIRPQVNGIITERLFEEGTDVEKGQALYQIDDTPYKATLASRVADLKSAQADLTAKKARDVRYQELIKTNAVSGQAYDDVIAELNQSEASVAVAQASVQVAQVDLDYTRVYAPISGRIGKSSVTEGALVTTNQTENLAVITQLDPVFVDISQPGEDAMRLRMQMAEQNIPVEIIIDRSTSLTHPEKGELKFSDVVVDETTGSIGLRAHVPNPKQTLLPGLFVHAKLDLGEREVVLVPQRAAVRNQTGGINVWVLNDENVVNPRPISVSAAYQDQWIVAEGIAAGEKIVIEGYQKIGPGMTVVPSPWVPAQ
jgi:membrane fusion protein, multidrug efflux system